MVSPNRSTLLNSIPPQSHLDDFETVCLLHTDTQGAHIHRLSHELLARILQHCTLATRLVARRSSRLLRDPASKNTSTLAGTTDALPVPWASFPDACRLKVLRSAKHNSSRVLSHIELQRYLQLCADLPEHVTSIELEDTAVYFTTHQGLKLAAALSASAPAASGTLSSLRINNALHTSVIQALLSSLPSLRQLVVVARAPATSPHAAPCTLQLHARLTELRIQSERPERRLTIDLAPSSTGSTSSSLQRLWAWNVNLQGLQRLPSLELLSARDLLPGRGPSTAYVSPAQLAACRSLHTVHLQQHVLAADWAVLSRLPALSSALLGSLELAPGAAAAVQLTGLTLLGGISLQQLQPQRRPGCMHRLFPSLRAADVGSSSSLDAAADGAFQGHPALKTLTMQQAVLPY